MATTKTNPLEYRRKDGIHRAAEIFKGAPITFEDYDLIRKKLEEKAEVEWMRDNPKPNPPLPRSPQWEKAQHLSDAWYIGCKRDTGVCPSDLLRLIRMIEEALYAETHR